jgi:hypothetical protein
VRRGARPLAAVALILCGLLLAPDEVDAKKRPRRKRAAAAKTARPNFDTRLPLLGTRLVAFPAGPGKPLADRACLACHSGDMVAQQRLTEKQWAAEVTKMAVWGADIPHDKREELVAYLVNNFGPGAPKYEPVLTRPVGR